MDDLVIINVTPDETTLTWHSSAIENTSLILIEQSIYTTHTKQLTSTKIHYHAVMSILSTLNVYYTQTYYEVTSDHAGTLLSYLKRNSYQ